MSDVTDPTEPHPVPATPPEDALTPEDAPAPIPPEAAEAQARGETSPVIGHDRPIDRRPRERSGTRVLVALGFLLLFGAVAWEYLREDHLAKHLSAVARVQNQGPARVDAFEEALRAETAARTSLGEDVAALKAAPHPPETAGVAPRATDLGPLEARLKEVEQKVSGLAAAPQTASGTAATTSTDLGPIEARLKEVEQKVAGLAAAPQTTAGTAATTSTDIGPIESRLNNLDQKVASLAAAPKPASEAPAVVPSAPPVDLGPIEARLKTLEDKPAPVTPPPAPAPDVALLARVNTIADQLDGLGKKLAEAQTQAEAAQAGAQAAQARATAILTRAAATVALADGKPLGPIPHAPPALARFAVDPPPTEASLRLSYDEAAQRSQDASVPPTAGKKFGARMLTRIESLVTVSQGDHVLVGPPAATILAGAHERLQAGDLPGAVATLDGLDPAARAAMAGWIARAQALLDARAALQSAQFGAP